MKSDILIVGAGPAGLVLACTLAQKGIKAKIIDKRSCSSQIPRAINISSPVLKILSELDLGLDVLQGKKLDELKVYWNKKPLLNINYKYYKPDYPFFYHVEQSSLETYLENRLNDLGVKVDRQISIDNLVVQCGEVKVTLIDCQGSLIEERYSHVIGCDGGSSTVRNLAGIQFLYESYPCHFVLVDGEVEHKYESGLNKLHYYLSEDGYLIVAPISGSKCRFISSFKGSLTNEKSPLQEIDNFKEIVGARGPAHLTLKNLTWATSGNFFHRIAVTAQKENIFLVGDAIHQFSPVGGANMNIGIQDAFSLGQKLLSSRCDQNSDNSLMTYSEERLNIARKYIETTASMTHMLTRHSSINSHDAISFLPLMKNRKFIKHILPAMFSGELFIN